MDIREQVLTGAHLASNSSRVYGLCKRYSVYHYRIYGLVVVYAYAFAYVMCAQTQTALTRHTHSTHVTPHSESHVRA